MVIIAIICIVYIFVSKIKDFTPIVFIIGFRFCTRNEVHSTPTSAYEAKQNFTYKNCFVNNKQRAPEKVNDLLESQYQCQSEVTWLANWCKDLPNKHYKRIEKFG